MSAPGLCHQMMTPQRDCAAGRLAGRQDTCTCASSPRGVNAAPTSSGDSCVSACCHLPAAVEDCFAEADAKGVEYIWAEVKQVGSCCYRFWHSPVSCSPCTSHIGLAALYVYGRMQTLPPLSIGPPSAWLSHWRLLSSLVLAQPGHFTAACRKPLFLCVHAMPSHDPEHQIMQVGRSAAEVLTEELPALVASLSFKKSMRWRPDAGGWVLGLPTCTPTCTPDQARPGHGQAGSAWSVSAAVAGPACSWAPPPRRALKCAVLFSCMLGFCRLEAWQTMLPSFPLPILQRTRGPSAGCWRCMATRCCPSPTRDCKQARLICVCVPITP